jgi:hypothetical protein
VLGVQLDGPAEVFAGAVEIAAVVGLRGGGHQMIETGGIGLIGQSGGEVAAGAGKLASFELQFGEPDLCLLGSGGGHVAE